MELVDAMRKFRECHPRSPSRQKAIQLYCCSELEKRGLAGTEIEVDMPGAYRVKKWDVGLFEGGEPHLGISCKSIVSNHGGTVPNRVDDMLGEAANLHRMFPNAVLGYLFMMSRVDESQRTQKKTETSGGMSDARLAHLRKDGDHWFERLVESVSKAAGRSGADDRPEMFEAVSCSQVDFMVEPYAVLVHEGAMSPDDFFDHLVALHRERFR